MSGPLTGVRIIEFAGIGPGPFCGMMLADHGAEVIRIDRVGAKDLILDAAKVFLNRSRRSIAVDLKNPEGIALVRKMCASADAVIEGYRPGVMERLGLGPGVLLEDNPRLVYGRMTGFGQHGPYADMAGHDINYIALSGALHSCGRGGQNPTPPLNLVGDFGGGAMMLAFGMLAAIISARSTGQGQVVDAAMTDGSAVLMAMIYSLRAENLWTDDRGANFLDGSAHYYDSYETADGKYVCVGPVEPHFYRDMVRLIGLGDDPDMEAQDDIALWPQQKVKVAEAFRRRTRDEWCDILKGTDACFAPVMSLDEAPHHEHNVAREAFVEVDGKWQPAPAPRYSVNRTDTPRPLARGAEVASAVLGDFGFSAADIERLQQQKIVA